MRLIKNFKRDTDFSIFEAILREAVTDASLKEAEGYPDEEAFDSLVLPEHFEKSMNDFIKAFYKEKQKRRKYFYIKAAAAVFLFASALSLARDNFESVRAAYNKLIYEITSRYNRYIYTEKETVSEDVYNDNTPEVSLSYVPSGFSLTENSEYGSLRIIVYENPSGEKIELSCYFDNVSMYLDNEHYSVSNIEIGEAQGQFYLSLDSAFSNMLLWRTDYGIFLMSSYIAPEEMIHIADGVSVS